MTTKHNAAVGPRSIFSSLVGLLGTARKASVSTLGLSTTQADNASVNNEKLTSGDAQQGASDTRGQDVSAYGEAHQDNIDRRRYVRTLPPWIHSLEEGENADIVDPHARLLPSSPPAAQFPHHNHMPIPKPRPDGSQPEMASRFRDALNRPDRPIGDASRWQSFARASAFPRTGGGDIVSPEWMEENLPDLDRPLTPMSPAREVTTDLFWFMTADRRKAAGDRWNNTLMRNPFVPLVIRLTVMTFCAAALALGAWIFVESKNLNIDPTNQGGVQSSGSSNTDYICEQQTSTYMAFIVNSFAVLYLFYITWDEYFSKPLGLRRTRAKLRLIFLDLLFIVFSAADLGLAFNTMTDAQWSCYPGFTNNDNNVQAARTTCVFDRDLCNRQKALVSMLFVAEVAWLMTFSISVLRVVERISS